MITRGTNKVTFARRGRKERYLGQKGHAIAEIFRGLHRERGGGTGKTNGQKKIEYAREDNRKLGVLSMLVKTPKCLGKKKMRWTFVLRLYKEKKILTLKERPEKKETMKGLKGPGKRSGGSVPTKETRDGATRLNDVRNPKKEEESRVIIMGRK